MKRKSKFSVLPEKEQAEIIGLCEAYTFNQVVEFLAKPRPEGFGLKTSYSALRRFYTNHHPQAYNTAVLAQLAQSLCHHYENSNGAFSTAIMSMLESRLLTALKNEIPTADLQVEFRTLFNAQKAFLALQKWRVQAGPNSAVIACPATAVACPATAVVPRASSGVSPEQFSDSGPRTQDSGLDSSDSRLKTQDPGLKSGFIRQNPSEKARKAALAAKSRYEKIHEQTISEFSGGRSSRDPHHQKKSHPVCCESGKLNHS